MADDFDIGSPLVFHDSWSQARGGCDGDGISEASDPEASVAEAPFAEGGHAMQPHLEGAAVPAGADAGRDDLDLGELLRMPFFPKEKYTRRSHILLQHARGEREIKPLRVKVAATSAEAHNLAVTLELATKALPSVSKLVGPARPAKQLGRQKEVRRKTLRLSHELSTCHCRGACASASRITGFGLQLATFCIVGNVRE